jgi:hypothetical protein
MTRFEKPHWGALGVPFINNKTGFSSIKFKTRSFGSEVVESVLSVFEEKNLNFMVPHFSSK